LTVFNRLSAFLHSSQKAIPASETKKNATEAGITRQNANETVIIGVGNEFRGDDAAGIQAARRLAALKLPNFCVIEQSGEGADLIDAFENAACVYVIDAVSSQGLAGSIYRFEAHEKSLPARYFGVSSHAFGVAEAIEIARSLDRLPPKLVVYGIEGSNFETGSSLNPVVEQAVENVIRKLLQEIGFF
jgi:hydrogenase maturation protease